MSRNKLPLSLFMLAAASLPAFENRLPSSQSIPPVKVQQKNQTKFDTTVYLVVESPPEFIGGRLAMIRFIEKNSRYRISTIRIKDAKVIHLKLLVEKDGVISKVIPLVSDAGKDQQEEIKRVISQMPNWKPGSQSGRLLRSYSILSIYFL
ncbi:hypothetical protein [Dyadobacter psychrotolerans]|uniref:TonB C-terminal domain-containing protein n=1 Tax=Dyadobacter psychrotolerans TaxID=2541721 RepID=A0A4R5DV44_9BACT|nr:hypothetical protein [Dyadobacter psychrotolerans]TDE14873.1 hypothetical protein E0F88_16985 [Dyadobacter psychrotolerans]